MTLNAEQARIVREIDGYLGGKHDADKKLIAASCKQAVPYALTYRELLASLEAYRAELLRLVGKKNASRWFSHNAGAFDTTLRKAIERCRTPAANEDKLASGTRAPLVTLKDWNRHGGGRVYVVNGRGFSQDNPTHDDIRRFLLATGVTSPPIVDFLCDFANQDGLFATGHLFGYVLRNVSGYVPSATTHSHTIDRHETGAGVRLRDDVSYNVLMNTITGSAVVVDPELKFVQTYDLIASGRQVHLTNVVYSIEGGDGLTPTLREQARSAAQQIGTATL
jgi:hypothetical protein